MGYELQLSTIGTDTLEALSVDPHRLLLVLDPYQGEEMYRKAKKGGFLKSVSRYLRGESNEEILVPKLADGEGEICHLDKAWDGLYYLLSGESASKDFSRRDGDDFHSFLITGESPLKCISYELGVSSPSFTRGVYEQVKSF